MRLRPDRRSEVAVCRPRPLDRLDVDGLRTLVALLRVVGDLRALLQRAISLAVDSGVMNEQVLVAVVGGDETEPLVVAEPLYGASRHVGTPPQYVRAARGGCFLKLRPASACTSFAGLGAGQPRRR